MKIDMYPSSINKGKFLAVPAGTDFASWPAPANFDPDLKSVYPLSNTLDIQATDVGRIAMNPVDVINQINQKGWALVEVNFTIKIREPGQS